MNWHQMIEKRKEKEAAFRASPSIQYSASRRGLEVERAMLELSPLEQRALTLRLVHPTAIARVADRMGMSWDGADELIDRAVTKLDQVFKKSNGGEAA